MKRIVGIDLSLTSTGIAVITQRADGTCIANTITITSRGKRDDQLPQRHTRLRDIAQQIAHTTTGAVLAGIEGPSYGSRGGSALDRYGLWWNVTGRLLDQHVPVAICAPTTRAKWATGRGNADKPEVTAALTRLWPDLELNGDTADALAIAHACAQRLNWNVPILQRHRDALSAIKWPDGLPPMPTMDAA